MDNGKRGGGTGNRRTRFGGGDTKEEGKEGKSSQKQTNLRVDGRWDDRSWKVEMGEMHRITRKQAGKALKFNCRSPTTDPKPASTTRFPFMPSFHSSSFRPYPSHGSLPYRHIPASILSESRMPRPGSWTTYDGCSSRRVVRGVVKTGGREIY